MKKSILLLLMGGLALCLTPDMYAQNYGTGKKKKKKAEPKEQTRTERDVRTDDYFDDDGNLAAKLWYGGSGTFGFGGNNFQRFFQIGARPLIGYKITPAFSLGPTFGVTYLNLRESCGIGADGVCRLNAVEYGVGAFARYRVIPAIFAHVELYQQRTPEIVGTDVDGRFQTAYFGEQEINIGAGYSSNSGGALGSEIMVLYNVNEQAQFDSPFSIRVGLNYKF